MPATSKPLSTSSACKKLHCNTKTFFKNKRRRETGNRFPSFYVEHPLWDDAAQRVFCWGYVNVNKKESKSVRAQASVAGAASVSAGWGFLREAIQSSTF
jgi:hypothetical protein